MHLSEEAMTEAGYILLRFDEHFSRYRGRNIALYSLKRSSDILIPPIIFTVFWHRIVRRCRTALIWSS